MNKNCLLHRLIRSSLHRATAGYLFQIQAQTGMATNEGWGNRSVAVCKQTEEGLPTEPISLQSAFRNESCISVQWMPPTTPNGLLISYKVKSFFLKCIMTILFCKITSPTSLPFLPRWNKFPSELQQISDSLF